MTHLINVHDSRRIAFVPGPPGNAEAQERYRAYIDTLNDYSIPEEIMDRLFEPLFSTKSFGVRLGLSIVKSIMEQHGGGVEIESQAGEGTDVTLWLPMSDVEDS